VLSVLLRYTDSDYPFGISKLFLLLAVLNLIFRRNRIRSLLTYFCNYGRFCLTTLLLENNTNLVRVRRTDLKHL